MSKLIQQHIDNLLKAGKYSLTNEDKKFIEQKGLQEWMLSKLLSKKFRKTKIDPECLARTRKAIELRLSENKPIRVVFPQGGYKLWRLPSTPEADWAEFFNISYLLEYVAPLAAAYKPGVEIVYYFHTLLMERHDNLTTDEITAYRVSFERLVHAFTAHMPKNVSISILRDADIYSREEYFHALESGVEAARTVYDAYPDERKDRSKRMSWLNIKWDGAESWDKLGKAEKEKQVVESILYEISATSNLPKVMARVKADENVLVFTAGTPQFINIGSTRASQAKYWVGYGVLEKNTKGKLVQRVLSPGQFGEVKSKRHQVVKVDRPWGKNFAEIWVYPESLR